MLRPRFKSKKASSLVIPKSADHQRLVALVNSLTDGVLAISTDGQIMLSNSAALSLFDTNTLIGRSLDDTVNLIDKAGRVVRATSLLNKSQRGFSSRDLRLKYSDDSNLNLDLTISPVRAGFGSKGSGGYVVLVRDITQEKSLENERSEFISVASHELRTPIAITEGNISNALVLAQKHGSSESIIEALNSAHDQIVFLSSLINDLSMLSRAERGGGSLNPKAINVNQMVDDLIDSYQSQAEAKGLALTLKLPREKLELISNELYVKEILQNFLSNSIKYTEKGTIELTAEAASGGLNFSVTDSGIGITQSDQQKLFTKFFRSENYLVQKVNGSGLGLYVCLKLAKLLSGKIDIESRLGQGSRFSLFVPNIAKTGD